MTSFLALYRGDSVATAELVTISADPEVVRDFADRMLSERGSGSADPALDAIDRGRRDALELVRDEAEEGAGPNG